MLQIKPSHSSRSIHIQDDDGDIIATVGLADAPDLVKRIETAIEDAKSGDLGPAPLDFSEHWPKENVMTQCSERDAVDEWATVLGYQADPDMVRKLHTFLGEVIAYHERKP